MKISEDISYYEETFRVENRKVDHHHLVLYECWNSIDESGIYNILEHLECIPVNVVKRGLPRGQTKNKGQGKSGFAIVEFGDKDTLDRAFYLINQKHTELMKAQY